jgi:alpha-amylase
MRSAIYHHLIKAENAADAIIIGRAPWQRYEFTDFDRDTQDELLIEGNRQNLYIDPQRGGTLFEWDMRRAMHNLLCVMTRREEGYHQVLRDFERERRALVAAAQQAAGNESQEPVSPHSAVKAKEPDLDRYLVVDRYRRHSLVDHFFGAGTTLEHFAQARHEECGTFVEQPYEAHVEQDTGCITVTLRRDGIVKRAGALGPLPISLTKTLVIPFDEEKLIVRYHIQNRGQTRLQTRFACEWNFNLLGGGANDQAYYHIDGHTPQNAHFDSTGETPEVQTFHIGNTWLQQDIGFSLSEAAALWRFSIDTVTGSEAGFERTHQGSCLTLVWPLLLEAGESWNMEIECKGESEMSF